MRYLTDKDVYAVLTEVYHHRTDIQHKALRDAINSVPTADVVEHKKGKWINDRGLYRCSYCNQLWTEWWVASKPIERMKKESPYCPMCGSYNGEESENEVV